MIGLYKHEAVASGSPFRTGPLHNLADVEAVTIDYVHWYNEARLHSALNYTSPEEHERTYYAQPPGPPPGDAANNQAASKPGRFNRMPRTLRSRCCAIS